jgi:hypothetical protein
MATTTRRLGEKGQRMARSTNVYAEREALKDGMQCGGCGAEYRNKRWYLAETPTITAQTAEATAKPLCAACQRLRDDNPAGILTMNGQYFHNHEPEILNRIRSTEAESRLKNPLGRIMTMKHEGDTLVIATTEDKLAQKLGRDLYRAHGGALEYQWSRDQHFVRVNWNR